MSRREERTWQWQALVARTERAGMSQAAFTGAPSEPVAASDKTPQADPDPSAVQREVVLDYCMLIRFMHLTTTSGCRTSEARVLPAHPYRYRLGLGVLTTVCCTRDS